RQWVSANLRSCERACAWRCDRQGRKTRRICHPRERLFFRAAGIPSAFFQGAENRRCLTPRALRGHFRDSAREMLPGGMPLCDSVTRVSRESAGWSLWWMRRVVRRRGARPRREIQFERMEAACKKYSKAGIGIGLNEKKGQGR